MNTSIQFYKPADPLRFVGDCMPFSHAGTFYFFYLIDENHHQGMGGLGGHQWALATSSDLISWQDHPLALPISADFEGSICTGSVLFHAGKFYAFYATRRRDFTQHLGLAISEDGIHYEKVEPNPLFSPPAGYDPYHFRDPFPFVAPDGSIHLLVSAFRQDQPLPQRGGCLAHLVSSDPHSDLRTGWELREPFFVPGAPDVPECSDLFEWNGWYYLIYGSGLQAHYRLSRSLFGPWQRPPLDVIEAPAARVMKTAAWNGRRIGVAWLGTKEGDRDAAPMQWGGQALFRELIQQPDGSLCARPLEEARPPAAAPLPLVFTPLTPAASPARLTRSGGLEALSAAIPHDGRLRLRLHRSTGAGPFGLKLRAAQFEEGYPLEINPAEGSLRLADQELRGLRLDETDFEIDLTLSGSILDLCVNGRWCLAARCPEQNAPGLWLYALDTEITLLEATFAALLSPGIG